ncbi:restriction endonuclease subunit S [Nocardia cyriacigeorgica]|uniref:Restriction endonuclease n=1 Tax=Nocardia cyriacigeorgica TaxID=135487 RepID=A0A5R8NYA1_9NOCA|nr:restriction endonuclease subunit S [Nocardia cyriacigeorgica]TLF81267.1 restriction endonuclease [Nocardia cyriacigeorgica]
MSAWPIKELAHVATILRIGINPRDIDGDTKYVGLENIESGGRIINVSTAEAAGIESQKYQFTADHILYGKLRPYLAKIARPNFGGVCSTDILPIEPSPAIDRNYLCHFLSQPSMISKANARATGVNLPRINPAELGKFTLPVPPIAVQRRIAEVLDHVDALREKRRKSIALLDELAQSIFLDMFGDPSKPSAWPVRTIGDLTESATYGTAEKAAPSGPIPVLRMNNITYAGRMDLRDLKYLASEPPERYMVRAGDILFNRTNSAELVGKTAVFTGNAPMAYAGYLIRLRANCDNDPDYISSFLNTSYSKRVLRAMCKSIVGMANINAKELKSIRVPQPPYELQRIFAHRLRQLRSQEATHRSHLAHLDTLFSSLQSRAFRGELWQDDLKDL